MKITERQLLQLFEVLACSIQASNYHISANDRKTLYLEILKQQGNEIIDITGTNNPIEEKV